MAKVVGVIPAKSGSQRVKDKNIKPLAGRPLIYYTIHEALKAKTLDRVIVSTDSKNYAEVAEGYGAEVPFLRPKRLSGGDVDMPPVLIHCVEYLEKHENYHAEAVATLQPTSPFRVALDIDNAVNKLFATGADSVVSVREVIKPPNWMFKLEGDKMIRFLDIDIRTKLPKLYLPNGAVFVTRRDVLMKERQIYVENCRAIVMPPERSLDIDTLENFEYAEYLMEKRGVRDCDEG